MKSKIILAVVAVALLGGAFYWLWKSNDNRPANIIGIVVSISLAYIAYQNYGINKANTRIQKDKLRLDLFDRRYKVFQALKELLSSFITTANFTHQELYKFANESSDAEFLFGIDIKNYVDEIFEKGIHLIYLKKCLEDNIGEREKTINEIYELEIWLSAQSKNAKNLFKKYLHFSIDKNL
jgi:hypothetical protein